MGRSRTHRRMALAALLTLALVALPLWAPAQEAPPAEPTPEPATPPPAKPTPFAAETWGAQVGFAPTLEGAPAAGTTVRASNLAEHAQWVALGVALLVEKYALVLDVVDYQPIHPSVGYIAATNQYRGQPRLKEGVVDPRVRSLEGYTAGLPFPQPKTGLELAYDYTLSYRGDDGSFHYGVYWISAATGVERWEEWRWEYINRCQFRTDLEPIPAFPELAAEGVTHLSLTYAVAPHDKRGFASVYKAFEEPRDIQGWIYLPPTRRTLRMAFGTRGDAWNSTDLLHEDVGGYAGHPEWMSWKILERRTVLAPAHAGLPHGKQALKEIFDFARWPHWNLRAKWEPRPVYVVEATPRLEDYPYQRMILYFDAETFAIPFKVAYDRKGELWKVIINASNGSPDMDEMPGQIGTALVVDLQSEHATAFPAYGHESNVGHDPEDFTLTRLRRMGK